MSHDHERFDGAGVLDELDDARLRDTVERVRNDPLPEDALARALERASQLASVAAVVRRQPTQLKPARRKLALVAFAVGLVWLIAAGVWTVKEGVDEAREAARQSTAHNNLRQMGLAVHNYHDYDEAEFYGKESTLDGGGVFFDSTRTRYRAPMNGYAGDAGVHIGGGEFTAAVAGDTTLAAAAAAQKKMIQTAEVSLVVKELAAAEAQLRELIQKHKGEVDDAQVSQAQGKQRSARWVIRVPAGSLDGLLVDIGGLGISENRAVSARDVTEEYIDLETRIASKKQLEQRILALLEKQTGNIKDVLEVEEQLARIRSEVESMEGRKKYLDTVTAMSTVTVSAREQAEFIPPEVDSFSNQIGRAWGGSLDLIKDFGKSIVLVAVALGPWLPLLGIAIFAALRLVRRRKARLQGAS
jgi:hypothetical protein